MSFLLTWGQKVGVLQKQSWKCRTVSCNCGVAAQEGDDVVVIDMCRDGVPRARFASTVEPRANISRDNNGKDYVVWYFIILT